MSFISKLFSIFSSSSPEPVRTASEIGNKSLNISLNSLDGRRLRSQYKDDFRATLWYASQRDEICVYGARNGSQSTKPIGVIPIRFKSTVMPYLNRDDETVSYSARFNKSTRLLRINLNYRPMKEILEERRILKIESEKSEIRLKAQRAEQLKRPYELKNEVDQELYLGSSTKLKRVRKLKSLTIGLLAKEKYISDRKLIAVNLFEEGDLIGTFNADFRIIRALYSGQKLHIKNYEIGRERSFGETQTTIYFTISPHE
ncbi:MAG: hypothetical protein RIG77_08480 [Cyclobacteriaceae bacterium]